MWSRDTDSNVPIRAGDKKHNDSLQTGYKQPLDAGVSVLYTLQSMQWTWKMGIVVGIYDLKRTMFYIIDKIVPISQSFHTEVFPFSTTLCCVLLHVTRYA